MKTWQAEATEFHNPQTDSKPAYNAEELFQTQAVLKKHTTKTQELSQWR